MSGLPASHELADHDLVEPSSRAHTIIGTSYEAWNENVRARARLDARKHGEAWERQWVLGDFRLPSVFVYSEWSEPVHVTEYDHERFILKGHKLPRPSGVYGVIDWAYSPNKPGAAVVFHWWAKNPIDRERRQPLVIAVHDHQEALPYNRDGWYRVLRRMRQRYGVQVWYADPSMPELLVTAKKGRIGFVKPAEKGDKAGRINLVKSLLYSDGEDPPAFYVHRRCENLRRQFESYHYILDSKGAPTDRPTQYDDHALDCCAFMAGTIMPRGLAVPAVAL